jgi:hypothetical protein
MDEFLSGVVSAPLGTLLTLSGIIFLFVAVVGRISGKIEPGAKGRILSGVVGFFLMFLGLGIHFSQHGTPFPGNPNRDAATNQSQLKSVGSAELSQGEKSAGQEPQISRNPQEPTEFGIEKEPNDQINNSQLVQKNIPVRGSLTMKGDRDYYRFRAPGNLTRIILRKPKIPGFSAEVEVYDAVEKVIAHKRQWIAGSLGETDAERPVTFAFESISDAEYFIVVKAVGNESLGDYELVIRPEAK